MTHLRGAGRKPRSAPAVLPYKVGSQPPERYIAWHEWAAAQYRGGLRQKRCAGCGLWRFPQEQCTHMIGG